MKFLIELPFVCAYSDKGVTIERTGSFRVEVEAETPDEAIELANPWRGGQLDRETQAKCPVDAYTLARWRRGLDRAGYTETDPDKRETLRALAWLLETK